MYTTLMRSAEWLFSEGFVSTFYSDRLRSDFFNGFLSLAGFMLAAKTFIVIHMKQEVYDNKEYGKRFYERKELLGESALTRYGALEKMSSALYWIVVSSVIVAALQITIGLIPWNFTALLCIASAAFALWKLTQGLGLIKANLDSWFEVIADEEHKRIANTSSAEEPSHSKD